jgi:phosphatidylinositol glycan class B
MTRTAHRIEWIALVILLLGHGIASWTSFGYHHPDEHYQILEWANHFLGLNRDTSALPWEFSAQIRPWFQPLLHAAWMKALMSLGLYEPFTAAQLSQGIYGILNIHLLVRIWLFMRDRYGLGPHGAIALALLWFFPYIHVRTSSENLAGILLSWGLLGMLQGRSPVRNGIFFGFAFLARYQIAVGLAGLGIALLFRTGRLNKSHLALLGGFTLPVVLGVLLDRIGYGNWVLSPYLYFKVNLVDGVAARYNPYPWWMYFRWILELNPLVSVPLFIGSLGFFKKSKEEDGWILSSFMVSFFALHCLITNKEYRFLFPILNWIPFMALIYFRDFTFKLARPIWWIPFAVLNLSAFAISTLHGASLRTLGAPFLAHRNLDPDIPVLASRDYRGNPPYYTFPVHRLTVFGNPGELGAHLSQPGPVQVLLDGKADEPTHEPIQQLLQQRSCRLLEAVVPGWLSTWVWKTPAGRSLPRIEWYRCP